MKKIFLILLIVFWVFPLLAQIEPLRQRIDMRIDSIGNAYMKVSMTMNAGQWQMWLQSGGNNPAIMKRTMERALPGYFLDEFNLVRNDMERSFEFSFKAYGACQVNRRGKWIVNTEQKNAEITTLTDRKYMMASMDAMNNLQITQFLDFPSEARNITISKDAYDRTQFEFDMDSPAHKTGATFWIGLLLILSGSGWLLTHFFNQSKPELQKK
jgi:hypothetical protein